MSNTTELGRRTFVASLIGICAAGAMPLLAASYRSDLGGVAFAKSGEPNELDDITRGKDKSHEEHLSRSGSNSESEHEAGHEHEGESEGSDSGQSHSEHSGHEGSDD